MSTYEIRKDSPMHPFFVFPIFLVEAAELFTSFLLGASIMGWLMVRLVTPEMWWAKDHPKEVQWVEKRFLLYTTARDSLFFDENDRGVTIVKPIPTPALPN